MVTKKRAYGWRPGLPDSRDHLFREVHKPVGIIPGSINLQSLCPPVYDQEDIGSCTANAIAGLFECLRKKEGMYTFTPSRLFIYWNERNIEGDVEDDSGAIVTDGMKVLQTIGAPHESLWWYNTKKFTVKPGKNVYEDAAKHKCGEYSKLNLTNLNELRTCLASGHPFVFGFTCYESFESDTVAKTGYLPMPGKHEQELGGHAVLCVGYNNLTQSFLIRNSWGPDWGLGGYMWMPYQYVLNPDLCDDAWTMKLAN